MRFVEANVVLHSFSTSAADASKSASAKSILRTHDQAWEQVEALTRCPVQEITLSLVARAIQSRQRFGISYWDAAILEAARMLGCDEVLSEDLNDGQDYDGVVVRNPFASS